MKQNKHKNTKSTVKLLREIRDKVNLDVKEMTTDELKSYFKSKRKIHPDKYQPDKQAESNN